MALARTVVNGKSLRPELGRTSRMDEQPRDDNPYFGAFEGVLLVVGWALFGLGVYYSFASSWAAASIYTSFGLGLLGAYIGLTKTDRA